MPPYGNVAMVSRGNIPRGCAKESQWVFRVFSRHASASPNQFSCSSMVSPVRVTGPIRSSSGVIIQQWGSRAASV